MKHLVLLPVALALFARELARAMVRAWDFGDDEDLEQFRRPGGGWSNR